MSDVSLPTVGQEPWGDDLNAYLASLEAKTSANLALIASLQAEVGKLNRRFSIVGRWQTNTQVGATPGGQQVTSDTGNFRQATWLRFSKQDQTSTDMTAMLSNSVMFVVQHQNDSTMWVHLNVTGPEQVTGSYVQVPVTCVAYGTPGVAWQNVVVTMAVILD